VVNGSGQAKKDELTIPTLAASSIYHEVCLASPLCAADYSNITLCVYL